ncbi:hypothetical protein UBN116_14380 [Helicobacter pylori]|nr:hypothetical protein FIM86_07355 [Helicobacter pylori]TPH93262.1 hypothetical protein FIM45_07165 [Helicobacter pylori]
MKTARYCLEFVSLGGLLRLGEYLRQKQSKVIANNIFWLKFLVGSHLAMKNAMSLIYRFKSIVQKHTLLKIKQKSLNQAQA